MTEDMEILQKNSVHDTINGMNKKKIIVTSISVFVAIVLVFLIAAQFVVVEETPSCCVCTNVVEVTLWKKMIGDYPHFSMADCFGK